MMIDAATLKADRRLKKPFVFLSLAFLSSIGMIRIMSAITTQEVQSTAEKEKISFKKNFKEKATTAGNRTTPYFTLWDYSTQSIHIPNKPPGAPLTSLEVLERVLMDNDVGNIKKSLPSCLVPNNQNTQALVDSGESLQLPILNLGMPKCGSTTLLDFFKCAGLKATHGQNGKCMKQAVLDGKPPIAGCRSTNSVDALCQLDVSFGNCSFPQISLLDEIHQEHPHATFIMNFRPVDDWIDSARKWNYNMVDRWSDCILPGLIKKGKQLTNQEIRNWWCGHVKHVREFVKRYPTHKLIELDLYDAEGSSKAMSSLFNANETCWGHFNANKKKATLWSAIDNFLDFFRGQ
jgi:hypothetical protein